MENMLRIRREAFQELMCKKGILSQAELARRVGCTRSQISLMLTKKSGPGVKLLGKCCVVLDCQPDDIAEIVRKRG